MNRLYTDAGYTWQNTEATEDGKPIMGRICVSDGNDLNKVEMVGVGRVPVLRQYINIFELIAVARAVEVAIENGFVGDLEIHTDSMVAMGWAKNGRCSNKVRTLAHDGALEYLANARKNFIGEITFHHVPRDINPAGIILEGELGKDRKARREGLAIPEVTNDSHEKMDS